jgi:hypothetical protein
VYCLPKPVALLRSHSRREILNDPFQMSFHNGIHPVTERKAPGMQGRHERDREHVYIFGPNRGGPLLFQNESLETGSLLSIASRSINSAGTPLSLSVAIRSRACRSFCTPSLRPDRPFTTR